MVSTGVIDGHGQDFWMDRAMVLFVYYGEIVEK